MKWLIILILLFIGNAGCDLQKREESLQKKETALEQKEQELLLKEKALALKEEELNRKAQHIDSTGKTDTATVVNTSLAGTWSVKMTCTETTCTGSAVGDTKTEQWEFSYQGNALIAKAKANEQLVRVYTGFYTGSRVELTENKNNAIAPPSNMSVRLRIVDETHLEGQREIVRENKCKVVYALQMEKQS